ncbi:ATP-binding cassette domain-containing protein [Pseudonocardia hispaniensis]|uniref:ATP-binding cassette domain-containing protein n=1 Tax=Pseudonocardia hispaniensis TaxID=904933 RepID=A0ABW1J571_9PSEU
MSSEAIGTVTVSEPGVTRRPAPAVELRGVSRVHRNGARTQVVVRDIDLAVAHGEFVAIVGPSGCGKSTLLGLIAGVDAPTAGEVRTLGGPPASARPEVGFVFTR